MTQERSTPGLGIYGNIVKNGKELGMKAGMGNTSIYMQHVSFHSVFFKVIKTLY